MLRTYKREEMKKIAGAFHDGSSYSWAFGESKSGSASVLHLLGYPKQGGMVMVNDATDVLYCSELDGWWIAGFSW